MATGLYIVAMLILAGVLAYHRAKLLVSTAVLAAGLVVGTVIGSVGQITWLIFAVIALPLNIVTFRRNWLSKPAFKVFKSVMPEMSATEKEAIDAGTVWWEADLFRGAPDWNKLHDIPAPTLSAEEQAFLDGPVNEVCRMLMTTRSRTSLPIFPKRCGSI